MAGSEGDGMALAMRVVVAVGERMKASLLLDITSAHIDSCLYHGQAGHDFVRKLAEGGAQVAVPATLNVASLDLLHPDLYRGDPATAASARELMDSYVALGCKPTWTCAPYQLATRPGLGEQVAWAESNATVFVNSVLGARSNRYGDFIDISCAVTGRAPAVGLHLDEGRVPTLHVDVSPELAELEGEGWFYPVLGYWLGRVAGAEVAIITGLPPAVDEDELKALGTSAATSGSVALFHVVGSTPEADRYDPHPLVTLAPSTTELWTIKQQLSTANARRVDAVSLGAPHFSRAQLSQVLDLFAGRRARRPTYLNTSRDMVSGPDQVLAGLEALGVTIVTDTCTYITPILDPAIQVVMTDSAKWAHYAPGNLGVAVVLGSLGECVETAVAG